MRDSLSRRSCTIGRNILKISNNGRSEGIALWNKQSQGGLITLKVERERKRERNQDGLCSYEAKRRWIHHIENGVRERKRKTDPNGLRSFEADC